MVTTIAYPAFFYDFQLFFPELQCPYDRKGNFDKELVSNSDLIIFSGGEDINPEIYGDKNRYSRFSKFRDQKEKEVFEIAYALGIKMLGVCRGHQLINALLGGYLIQDLLQDLGTGHDHLHELTPIKEITQLMMLFPNGVNSLHHQGVIKPGKGLTATSIHNGVIETCESENIITVQFHPEFLFHHDFFNYIKDWSAK